MPTRAVTIMCLVQVVFLVLAWMLTSKFVRFAERTEDQFYHAIEDIRQARMLFWFRSYGLLLLLAPVLIAYFCARLAETHRDIALVGADGTTLAIASTVVIALFSGYVVMSAMSLAMRGHP